MKVTSQGEIFSIHTDSLKTYESIPAQVYYIRHEAERGFYLLRRPKLEIKDSKVYGVHNEKCEKILNSFEKFDRNFGTILCGDKGTGKTLFAKLVSDAAVKRGYPVLIADHAYPEIGWFLESIEQECVVLFDEFDKIFSEHIQECMLSMLDGTSSGKKMFVITCNNIDGINEFMVNRPGRFHYYLRFGYPSVKEVRKYLEDKLPACYHKEIPSVLVFSKMMELNYDCLRAIAFELSRGYSFNEAMKDLNIVDTRSRYYEARMEYSDGSVLTGGSRNVSLLRNSAQSIFKLSDDFMQTSVYVRFNNSDIVWDGEREAPSVPIDKLGLRIQIPKDDDCVTYFEDGDYVDPEKRSKPIALSNEEKPVRFLIYRSDCYDDDFSCDFD